MGCFAKCLPPVVANGKVYAGTFSSQLVVYGLINSALSVSKSHSGNFIQGQNGATYSVTVSNAAGAATTSGTVTVTEMVPTGLTLVSMSGTEWNCAVLPTCTTTSVLGPGSSYPSITAT